MRRELAALVMVGLVGCGQADPEAPADNVTTEVAPPVTSTTTLTVPPPSTTTTTTAPAPVADAPVGLLFPAEYPPHVRDQILAVLDRWPAPCPVTFHIVDPATADGRSYVLSSVCSVHLDGEMITSDDWWTTHVILHELAHIATFDEPEAHGPRFRMVEAEMHAEVGMRLVYGPVGEYAVQYWVNDELVYSAHYDAILTIAAGAVGADRESLQFTSFWCAEFVTWVMNAAGYDIRSDSPSELQRLLPPVESPSPGDVVFVSFQPEHGGTHHVGIVESVNPDGSVHTIEGNGPDGQRVARGVRQPFEITGFASLYGVPFSGEPVPFVPFEDPLCEAKPWICE